MADSIKTSAAWREFWGLKRMRALRRDVALPGRQREGGQERTTGKLTADDFRLHNDSDGKGEGTNGRDIGADINKLGPGKAYEAWKKSPARQTWLLTTRQIVDAAPFVVLAVGRQNEPKFATLSAAVEFAHPGDIIEIRGDGPFVTEPVKVTDKA